MRRLFRVHKINVKSGGLEKFHNFILKDFVYLDLCYFQVPENVKSFKLQSMDSASIVIFIEGKGTLSNRTIDQSIPVKRGTVVFISAEEDASIEVSSNGMWLFRAHGG